MIPGSGRSPGKRIDYLLKYSWASLVAQTGKNPYSLKDYVSQVVYRIPLRWIHCFSYYTAKSLQSCLTLCDPIGPCRPAMWETWVQSLVWEDPLEEEGMATHSSILAWRFSMDRGAWWAIVHMVSQSRTRLSN